MAYTTALAAGQYGYVPTESGLVTEDITVTGAGDTAGTYSTIMKQPQYVIGAFTYSISGQTVTLGSASLTGVEAARIIGIP